MADFQDLKSKAVTASLWAIVEKFSLQIVQFVVSVILARILEPRDYGLIALTAIFTTLSGAIIDGGFEKTLIRAKVLQPIQVTSVFYVNLLLGCLLTVLLLVTARPIALFFHEPTLAPVLQVVALGLPVNALTQVQRVLLMKELRFRKISIAQIISSLAGGITGIVMACKGMGVWALVGSLLVFQLVTLVIFWIRSDWYPGFSFSYSSIRDMLPYGGRILVVSLLFFLMQQFNTFIVGKFYSKTDLGYFNRGGRLPDLLVSLVQSIVLKLAFPLFAKVRDEKAQLEELLRRTTQLVAFICFPLLALMLVNAYDITLVLFTAKWIPSVIFLELFCFITLLEPFVVIYRELILAKGNARLLMHIFLATSVFEIALVLFLAKYGILYVVVASIVGKTIQYAVYMGVASRMTNISWKHMLSWITPYLAISSLVGLVVKGLGMVLANTDLPPMAALGIKLAAGILLYLLLARLFGLNELSFIRALYRKVQKKIPTMQWKQNLYKTVGLAIRRSRLHRLFSLKEDGRPAFPLKLVYMCGREGQRYLNASLTSVYLFWDSLPEVIVISDGTPLHDIVRWPRKLEVISWQEAYEYFGDNGNPDLCRYADRLVYGKKFGSLVYLAQKTPLLYSDTDVLWYSTPDLTDIPQGSPYVKMGSDVSSGYYSGSLLECLGEHRCQENIPFNSGLMYISGDLSSYPKWPELCRRLADDHPPMGLLDFSEQTAFAILANHFNAASYFTQQEILIRTDDTYDLEYTLKHSPGIVARHYVNTRRVAFWRDFAYICVNKKLSA
ncbi:MAG TPA: lipopolysaccharide biosynthesis protein [Puia sp.]|jgi:teichuronic acid exporter|nr:lipopolysaccharide biosynthesis protein [Puia sp.]